MLDLDAVSIGDRVRFAAEWGIPGRVIIPGALGLANVLSGPEAERLNASKVCALSSEADLRFRDNGRATMQLSGEGILFIVGQNGGSEWTGR